MFEKEKRKTVLLQHQWSSFKMIHFPLGKILPDWLQIFRSTLLNYCKHWPVRLISWCFVCACMFWNDVFVNFKNIYNDIWFSQNANLSFVERNNKIYKSSYSIHTATIAIYNNYFTNVKISFQLTKQQYRTRNTEIDIFKFQCNWNKCEIDKDTQLQLQQNNPWI